MKTVTVIRNGIKTEIEVGTEARKEAKKKRDPEYQLLEAKLTQYKGWLSDNTVHDAAGSYNRIEEELLVNQIAVLEQKLAAYEGAK